MVVDTGGLRERKKHRTRQALIDAAVRLFGQDGYDKTTVADIAAAAEVSTRTFFLHFPSKEAIVFANGWARIDIAVHAIATRRPSPRAPIKETVERAMKAMIDDTSMNDLSDGMGALRVRLLAEVPALQAALVQRLFAAQAKVAKALLAAYPDRLDAISASAIVGALFGAVNAAALISVQQGDSADNIRAAMLRACDIASHGLRWGSLL
jgi:AcrR family transcriptional regulator